MGWVRVGNKYQTQVSDEDLESVSQFNYHIDHASNGYLYVCRYGPKRKHVRLHRELMGFPTGDVDHINGDTLDNRRTNLRVASRRGLNVANQRTQSRPKSSRFKGVAWDTQRGRWYAYIQVNQKTKSLGRHDDEVEAALAYNRAAVDLFGPFARLNDVGG